MRTSCVTVDRGFNTAVLKDPLGGEKNREGKKETTALCSEAVKPEEVQALLWACSVLGKDPKTCRGYPTQRVLGSASFDLCLAVGDTCH